MSHRSMGQRDPKTQGGFPRPLREQNDSLFIQSAGFRIEAGSDSRQSHPAPQEGLRCARSSEEIRIQRKRNRDKVNQIRSSHVASHSRRTYR